MNGQPRTNGEVEAASSDGIDLTRRGLSERLTDPYLTDHDRWVLGQFARFFSGVAPEPDPRAVRVQTDQHLRRPYARIRFR